jgi:PTS system cellobiose-specific IIC component
MLSGWIYSMFLKADIRIKMPEGVPDGVAAAFTGLIPAACILTGAVVIYGICDAIGHVTPIELIYRFVQTPLQNVGDSLFGVALFEFLIPLFWFFGVHGATVVGSVASPIAQANQLENAAIFQSLVDSGLSRSEAVAQLGANGGHIFTEAFQNCFQAITGSGITIGLVVFMVFFAKSAQMKQVGKLGLGCGIFNINEPVLFGTPIVLNPKLIVPFIAAPLIGNIGAYILTDIGFIPYTMGVTVPWTTPPILSGLIVVGWQGALWQLVEMVISFFLYLPFARSLDADYLAQEHGEAAA